MQELTQRETNRTEPLRPAQAVNLCAQFGETRRGHPASPQKMPALIHPVPVQPSSFCPGPGTRGTWAESASTEPAQRARTRSRPCRTGLTAPLSPQTVLAHHRWSHEPDYAARVVTWKNEWQIVHRTRPRKVILKETRLAKPALRKSFGVSS